MAELKEEEIHPEPFLRGVDLITMGFSPGPIFSEIFKKIEEAQLNGEIRTKEQAMEWVRGQYGK